MMTKPLNTKSSSPKTKKEDKEMTLLEAEKFLRKVGEWHGVVSMPRETIIKWAMFLKNKEINK